MNDIERLNMADRDTAEQVWALQHAAYREEAKRIGVSDLPPLQDTVAGLQACLETFYGIFTADGQLAGAVSTEQANGDQTVICRMMVHPDYFRQGMGSRLLQQVLSAEPPGSEWTVTAEIRNMPALRLYERHGFRRVRTFRPAPDITMVVLSRAVREAAEFEPPSPPRPPSSPCPVLNPLVGGCVSGIITVIAYGS
jgi:ribosomal protein S18 acetylase RimI-like enzyme